ncbi:low molecular weight phosphatase family protein [Paeniglutamicibacter sp. ABSL32-1]|uniref:arsenate-mycothiol transferase ArsC n=1 Tax=Paeniglutamicibacter quisquiliarum TaxID=2849498 RepID=UPI001C2DC6A0|nr:low molecular weight phosphatase family protein [Paeniglutamicibacter quisquiliarum]MBV1778760.1 low molecular weight phosphatase family protein [Paeniglutamicibacter quisquiliarum]
MEESARTPRNPAVLFVCVKNGGKSQMAAGLMRLEAGNDVTVSSAGTRPGAAINALSAEVLADLGVDISAERSKALTEEHMREAGLVVVLGAEAKVPALDGVRVETWETDEPSARGIEGRERMELVRDDIHARVKDLAARLLGSTGREAGRGA